MQTEITFDDKNYLNELNTIQRAAVECTQGPVMIIAGPGSGKTRVLTYRIAHLIKEGIAPYSILALTFTNKSAREMKARIQKIVGEKSARMLWMGTFHSIFSRILRIEAEVIGYPNNFTIYDTTDAQNLLKKIIKEQNLNPELYKANLVYNRISNAKNNLITAAKYMKNQKIMEADAKAGRARIGELYKIYEQRCFRAGAMDFDDLIVKMFLLLAKHPQVRKKYQDRFAHVLIDEFQDTNYAQYRIVKLLAAPENNVCVVGDDAQSIYAFRGATIENILSFEKDYAETKTFKLEQNYRSTVSIVKVANEVILNNRNQLAKEIWTENEEGTKVRLLNASSDSEEAKMVVDSIYEERLRNHFKNDDFAILYRTNAQSRAFEEALRKRGIPYQVFGGVSFYQRKEVKDVMGYLRMTVNPNDEEALRRVINYPTRGIGAKTIDKIGALALKLECPIWEVINNMGRYNFSARVVKAVNVFVRLIRGFREKMDTLDAYELTKFIGTSTGITKTLHNDKTVEGLSRYENIQELYNSVKQFTETKQEEKLRNPDLEVDAHLGTYLQEVSLLSNLDAEEDDTVKVTLMSIHSAKGLEFPCVYLVGMEEDLFPSKMSVKRNDLEEERRLFYVAITRAEKKLTLSYANSRHRFGQTAMCEPSRFINEISRTQIELIGRKPSKKSNFQRDSYSSFSDSVKGNLKSAQRLKDRKNAPKPQPLANFKADNTSKLQAGQTVLHQRFGTGKVADVEGRADRRMAIITFDEYGEKRILLRFAKLQILG